MLAISQTSNYYYCLEWAPSEGGLKSLKYKKIKYNNSSSKKIPLDSIIDHFKPINKKESNSLTLTISMDNVILFSYKVDSNLDLGTSIEWYEKNILGKYFLKNYSVYYYPFDFDNTNELLVLGIEKVVKNHIISISKKQDYILNDFSVDIFSSNIIARNLAVKSKSTNFLLWKILNNNKHYMLYNELDDNDNEYKCFMSFRINSKKKKIELLSEIGSEGNKNKIINFINSCIFEDKADRVNSFDKVFVYQTKESKIFLNKVLNKKKSNIELLDVSKIFFEDDLSDSKMIDAMGYLELGNSLKGIDV